jgi:hypothetical protein
MWPNKAIKSHRERNPGHRVMSTETGAAATRCSDMVTGAVMKIDRSVQHSPCWEADSDFLLHSWSKEVQHKMCRNIKLTLPVVPHMGVELGLSHSLTAWLGRQQLQAAGANCMTASTEIGTNCQTFFVLQCQGGLNVRGRRLWLAWGTTEMRAGFW